jgi:type II restriction enzyme
MKNFENLINTLQDSIFSRDYFADFEKIKENSFKIKIQLNILNSLL